MQASLGTVVVVVVIVAVVLAIVGMASSNSTWSDYGQGGMVKDRDAPRGPSVSPRVERDSEIRAMIEARNARRRRRGEAPLDVEAEIARLSAPDRSRAHAPPAAEVDPDLREEIRQLVQARSDRARRAGRPPLDVEAEVERELRRVRDL